MNHPAARNPESDDQAALDSGSGGDADEHVVRRSSLRSLSRPLSQCCMTRTRGNRRCGAPALANGKCRRHGGKNPRDPALERLRVEHSPGAPYRALLGNALGAAIVACRTQQRLLPLVEALTQRSQLDQEQGILRPGAPASDPFTSPT
jgi:hypothetical protein